MSENLRLDMYVNGQEYFIADAPVTTEGFEMCLNASRVITGTIAEEIRSNGGTKMETAEMLSEDILDVLWDITGKEMSERDEITFCMCLWNADEHIRSLVSEIELN